MISSNNQYRFVYYILRTTEARPIVNYSYPFSENDFLNLEREDKIKDIVANGFTFEKIESETPLPHENFDFVYRLYLIFLDSIQTALSQQGTDESESF